jgi:hypothetical protein
MVADGMPSAQDFPYQGGIPSDMDANLEKSSRNIVHIQQIEKGRSYRWVGAIIKRQCYGGVVTGTADGPAENLC